VISFRDMTFCPYWQTCAKGETCSSAVTPAVVEAATKWWGGDDFPIALYVDAPECHVLRQEEVAGVR
jgi:hypothetical protein